MSYRVMFRERLRNSMRTFVFLAFERNEDPDALEGAMAEIEFLLSKSPHEHGESREGNERVLIVHPLTIIYEIFEDSRVVLVYDAIYYPRRRM